MKRLFLLTISCLLLVGCVNKQSQIISESSSETEQVVSLKVDYTNDGGANIPTVWNEGDTVETVRKGNFTVGEQQFSIEFVGKWYISSDKQEYQTKKEPASYLRAASNVMVKKIVVEVFKADMEVYLTNDHTGSKIAGSEVTPEHTDGTALSYDINSTNWSILAKETYKGSNINIYSFTFYF